MSRTPNTRPNHQLIHQNLTKNDQNLKKSKKTPFSTIRKNFSAKFRCDSNGNNQISPKPLKIKIWKIKKQTKKNTKKQSHLSDFNLSVGCFGTDIIQKCTKWSQIGVHGLKIWPIFAKFQCASFLIPKNQEKWEYDRKKHKNVVFREKKSLRSYTGHTKVGKNKLSDIIYLNWINLNIHNEI